METIVSLTLKKCGAVEMAWLRQVPVSLAYLGTEAGGS